MKVRKESKWEGEGFSLEEKIYFLSPHFVFLSFSFVWVSDEPEWNEAFIKRKREREKERKREREKRMKWSMWNERNPFTPINILRISSEITHTSTNKLLQWKQFFFLKNLFEKEQTLKIRQVKIDSSQKMFQNLFEGDVRKKRKIEKKGEKIFEWKVLFFVLEKGFNIMFFGPFSWQLLLIEDYSCFFPLKFKRDAFNKRTNVEQLSITHFWVKIFFNHNQ